MSNIMNGKELSLKIEDEIKTFAKTCIIRPSVAVINIGNDPASEKFIKAKEEACNRAGIYFRYRFRVIKEWIYIFLLIKSKNKSFEIVEIIPLKQVAIKHIPINRSIEAILFLLVFAFSIISPHLLYQIHFFIYLVMLFK